MPFLHQPRPNPPAPQTAGAFRVETNAKGLQKALQVLFRNQVPFATAWALTAVAGDARDDVRKKLPTHFKIRNPRVPRGITINPALKSQWPKQFAEVGTRDPWMPQHVTGGIKHPERGAKSVAVPTRLVTRTGSGAVKPSQKPKVLRDKPSVNVIPDGQRRLITEDFDPERRERLVVNGKRVQRRDWRAQLKRGTWFFLVPQARIRRTWPFDDEVRAVVTVQYPVRFRWALQRAAETASRRAVADAVRQGRFMSSAARKISFGGN